MLKGHINGFKHEILLTPLSPRPAIINLYFLFTTLVQSYKLQHNQKNLFMINTKVNIRIHRTYTRGLI